MEHSVLSPNAAPPSPPIRILIVDDHQIVRMGLAALLGYHTDIQLVGEAEDAAQALAAYRRLRPSLVLMDLRIPGDGAVAVRDIVAEDPGAKILMLTTYDLQEDIHRCFQAGASGYMLKNEAGAAILHAIRTVLSGKRYLSDAVQAKLDQRSSLPVLTPRELEVLRLVAQGCSNREIADKLGFTEHTSKAHVKQILAKMGADDRTEAAMEAVKRGLVVL